MRPEPCPEPPARVASPCQRAPPRETPGAARPTRSGLRIATRTDRRSDAWTCDPRTGGGPVRFHREKIHGNRAVRHGLFPGAPPTVPPGPGRNLPVIANDLSANGFADPGPARVETPRPLGLDPPRVATLPPSAPTPAPPLRPSGQDLTYPAGCAACRAAMTGSARRRRCRRTGAPSPTAGGRGSPHRLRNDVRPGSSSPTARCVR